VSRPTVFRRPVALCLAAILSVGVAACGNSESTPTVEPVETATPPPAQSKFTVKQGVAKGYVDSGKVEGSSVLLTGWAASKDLTEVADEVVAQVGGKTVTQTVPNVERADVAAYYGKPSLKQSGFLLQIPISALECSASAGGVKVFGVLGGDGSQLPFVEGSGDALSGAC
jgi:hypothetical protein